MIESKKIVKRMHGDGSAGDGIILGTTSWIKPFSDSQAQRTAHIESATQVNMNADEMIQEDFLVNLVSLGYFRDTAGFIGIIAFNDG